MNSEFQFEFWIGRFKLTTKSKWFLKLKFLVKLLNIGIFKNLAVKIIEIVENNEAGFAFPSQSLYVEKLSDEKTEIFNPQSTKK